MPDYPRVDRFQSVSVVLPVMNETDTLRETVAVIEKDARDSVGEYLFVVCPRTTPPALAAVAALRAELGARAVLLRQSSPFIGGAYRDAFAAAAGSHVLMMASDLETDPNCVGAMIAQARRDPGGIVTASRWIPGGGFHGYAPIKLACNWVFQRFFRLVYATGLSDLTFGYRLFPTRLVRAIRWDDFRYPFLLETLVKPLRLGVPVTEVPAVWRARAQGESQNTFFHNFAYFRTGLAVRLASPRSLLLPPGSAGA
ncbi:MAG: glycosyltransferase [Elusimicrobia bacterium]|nr:glycosyltransferase [Elusimicrobiota bacterium]